jgi:hypothetical protein
MALYCVQFDCTFNCIQLVVFALCVGVMDNLTEQQRKGVLKMSHARLIVKLAQVGVPCEHFGKYGQACAVRILGRRIVASGKNEPLVKVGMTSVHEGALERERFEWEKIKWVQQLKMLEEVRAFQVQQLRMQLDFQEQQLNLQRQMPESQDAERKEKYSTVSRLKLWGDASRNSIIRMPTSEAVDLIPFLEHTGDLFCDLKVPDNLRIQLLLPCLIDKAQMLLTRLDPKQATDYAIVKQYLLHQFRLSPPGHSSIIVIRSSVNRTRR